MTTARDVIARAICGANGDPCDCVPAPQCDYDTKAADAVLSALLSADESVRMELAAKLVDSVTLPAPPSEDK